MLTAVLLASGCEAHGQNANNPGAGPSTTPTNPCADVGGTWDAKSGRCTLSKDGPNAVHLEVEATYPVDLVDNPTAGPVLGSFLPKFLADYGNPDTNGSGDANLAYKVFTHPPNSKTVLFQADWYFNSTPHPGGQISTFRFDFGQVKRLQLADLVCPGTDPLKAIPPITRPFMHACGSDQPTPHLTHPRSRYAGPGIS